MPHPVGRHVAGQGGYPLPYGNPHARSPPPVTEEDLARSLGNAPHPILLALARWIELAAGEHRRRGEAGRARPGTVTLRDAPYPNAASLNRRRIGNMDARCVLCTILFP